MSSLAQNPAENFESALIPKMNRAEVAYSSDKHSFTLDIISNNVKPQDIPGLVLVDNKVLQFVFIPDVIAQSTDTSELLQKEFLLAYMNYETDYVKNNAKIAYTNLAHQWLTIGGKLFLLWYYDMPPECKTVKRQINLSSMCFRHPLNLNTPQTPEDIFDDSEQLLVKVSQTLKLNDFKLDFDALYKQLNPK